MFVNPCYSILFNVFMCHSYYHIRILIRLYVFNLRKTNNFNYDGCKWSNVSFI